MGAKSFKKKVEINQKVNKEAIKKALMKSATYGDCFTPKQNQNKESK